MPTYQRIVHTADKTVNDCTNEFLVASASMLPALRDKGFREVGRTYGIKNRDFISYTGWIPNIPIVPVGGFTVPDSELDIRVNASLRRLCTEERVDVEAIGLDAMIGNIVSGVPIAGDLYLIDFQYSQWNTRLIPGRELILIPQGKGEPVYKTSPRHGLYIFHRTKRGSSILELIEPEASRIPYLSKEYPFKVNRVSKVGEMEIAPAFLRKVRTSPRMGWTGSSEYNPRLSRYSDFKKHVESKK